MNQAQSKVLNAITACIARTGAEYVSQGPISVDLGKLPHPNTLGSMERAGLIVRDLNRPWAAYKPV